MAPAEGMWLLKGFKSFMNDCAANADKLLKLYTFSMLYYKEVLWFRKLFNRFPLKELLENRKHNSNFHHNATAISFMNLWAFVCYLYLLSVS